MSVYPRGVPINLVTDDPFVVIDPITEVETPTDPTTVTFTVRGPDDVEVSYVFGVDLNVTKAATGVYVCNLAPPVPSGAYEWECAGTGAVQAVAHGSFQVLESDVQSPSPSPVPVPGPCEPWISGDDVAEFCGSELGIGSDDFLLANDAEMASSLLFSLSGRVFNGICTRTERPCRDACRCFAQTSAVGTSRFWYWTLTPGGGSWLNDCGDRCGCGSASYIELASRPAREVLQVKVDGAVVASSGYRLEGGRRLLRLSDPGPPVVANSWPSCQDLSLEDDQPGTVSVQYRWGIEPPELGKMAAAQMACELYKARTGGKCSLPTRVTKVVRQGVTMERLIPLASLLRQGASGLTFVDAFIADVNPTGARRRPAVWSPDVTRGGRRTG